MPAPSWAVVGADLSALLSVIADRALESDLGPAVNAIGAWVMHRGEPFLSAVLKNNDARILVDPMAQVAPRLVTGVWFTTQQFAQRNQPRIPLGIHLRHRRG